MARVLTSSVPLAGTTPSATAASGTSTVARDEDTGIWLIRLVGEHDISTVPLLERQTRSAWAGCLGTIVDVSETTFIDTAVANWFLRLQQKLEVVGASSLTVVVARRGTVANRLFAILGLQERFPCFDTLGDALAHGAASAAASARPPARRLDLVGHGSRSGVALEPGVSGETRETLQALLAQHALMATEEPPRALASIGGIARARRRLIGGPPPTPELCS